MEKKKFTRDMFQANSYWGEALSENKIYILEDDGKVYWLTLDEWAAHDTSDLSTWNYYGTVED